MTAGMRWAQYHCSVRATADDRGNSEQFTETLTDRSAQIDMENLNRHGR
jgi:hypothetical protein